jgi:hypothetical protein
VRITLRLAVYRQSVRLGDKLLETHYQNFYFSTEHLRLQFLCNILSDEEIGLSLQLLLGLASVVILRSESSGALQDFLIIVYIYIYIYISMGARGRVVG